MTSTSEPAHPANSRALQWSRAGLYGGLALLAALVLVETVLQIAAPGRHLVAGPWDNLVVGGLVGLIVGSLIVQSYIRLRRGQQRLEELIDLRYAEGYTDHAAGRSPAPLRLVRDPAHDR